jgi:1-acyl-sn-glycerol-3-phosphate acyltransferase
VRIPPRAVRRLLAPVEVAALVVLVVVWALLVVVGAVSGLVDRRRRLLRLAAFAMTYCGMELVVLAAAAGIWVRRPRVGRWHAGSEDAWVAANQALLGRALGWVLGGARRLCGFDVELADAPDPPALVGSEPVLVLARHGGLGDSFALVHLLLTRYERRVHIVLKDILQLDPTLDVLLNRLGSCFLPSRGDGLATRLGTIAATLEAGGALLVFPEGGNWTPARRRRAIRHLHANRKPDAARAATLMTHVLPARPAGVLACLEARPEVAVVVVAHAGLDQLVKPAQVWRQLPFRTPMTVRLWPAARLATGADEAARLAWLTAEWAVVDEWIEAYRHRAG